MAYISKVDNARKIYVDEIKKVQKSAEKWKDFLDFTANTNLSDSSGASEFSSKLIIHAYNPNAVDCRTYDDWKMQDGNHVKRYEKGIPILTRDRNGMARVAHVFDTRQTTQGKLPEKPFISEESKERLLTALQSEIRKFTENPRFNSEQKRLFAQTAEYKLCKQYGIRTDENAGRFSGIEKLSVNEIAFIGIALNGCSRSFAQIVNNERRMSNERNDNSKSGNDRTELQGQRRRGMGMGGTGTRTRSEVPIRRGEEPLVQTERGRSDIRTADRNTRTDTNSRNGEVRQSASEIHMADTVPDRSDNAQRRSGHNETLRGNERTGSELDRGDSGEEETITGVQRTGGNREIPAQSADVGGLQNTGGGRNTSGDSIRNMTEKTAEPENGSAVSDLSDKSEETHSPEKISPVLESQESDTGVQLSQEEFIEIASKLLSEDKTVSNAYRNSDKESYKPEIDNGADRIMGEILNGETDIGYSMSQIAPLYNQYFNQNNDVREHIRDKVSENVDAFLSSARTEKEAEETHENSVEKVTPDVPDTVSVGDKFRSKTTGEICEVVSLTGVMPWYTDECTVREEKSGYAVTRNISYDELRDPNRYEYIGNAELSTEKTPQENPEKETPENDNAAPTVADLSVGDIIRYEGKRREIEEIDDRHIQMKDLDASDFGGILLGTSDVLAYDGWQKDMNEKGFEILSKAEDLSANLSVDNADEKDSPQTQHNAENEINDNDSFNENAVKYAFAKITEEHHDDFSNPAFMYLGHLQNYMLDHKIDNIVVGASSETLRNHYGNAPHTAAYFSPDYTFSRDLPNEYNKYFEEYISREKTVSKETAKETDSRVSESESKEIPDKIVFEVFGGNTLYFCDEKMNNLAAIGSEGIKFYTELSEKDKKKVTDKAKEMQPEVGIDSEGEQLEFFHVEENRPYQVIIYDVDSWADENQDCATLKEARQVAKKYLKENYDDKESTDYGYAIYNKDTQIIEETYGYFPSERIFSFDVLLKNGIITPEQEPEMIKAYTEKDIHDSVIAELLKMENLKAAAINNSREDFAFPYFDAVNETLINMLENTHVYSTQKEISYLLDDEEYLHNVFGDYDAVLQQLNPSEIEDNRSNQEAEPDIKQLLNKFNDYYSDIYDSHDQVAGYHEAVVAGDRFIRENPEIMRQVMEARNDIMSGDREVAAFAFALADAGMIERFTEEEHFKQQNESREAVDTVSKSNDDTEKISSPTAEKDEKKSDNLFHITDEHLGEGSKKEKFRNNIEAIKTLQILESEERAATPEEKEKLSKYVGWGGLQEAFDDRIPAWNAEYYELKHLLTDNEYEAARSTVNDAFYTSPVVTQAIFEGLENIGFTGGEILEPSMGIGNFFGTMPDSMRNNSNLSGIEIDSISGRIAQKLYPEANIAINGFENVKPTKGSFDLAVGNVPFGNHGVNDTSKAYKGLLIHDYFFAKSLDTVRPGGVVAFITSTGTLDKKDIKIRQMLAQKAELMGAVRLPNNAFQKNAGTQTSTDIIFLKKREKPLNIGEMAADRSCDWVHTKENKDGLNINSYFADNPDMVLGKLSDNGRFGTVICTPYEGADLKEQLHEAMKNIKGEYTPLEFQQELDERATSNYLKATPDIENLTYTVVEDKLYFRVEDNLIPLKESEQHGVAAERRKAMCDLAETTRELLKVQVENRPDNEIKALQAELNSKYDRFAKRFGRINPIETPSKTNASGVSRKAPNSNVFKNDVRLPLLQSLERMKEGQYIGKAAIFTERTIRPRQVAEHVDTAQEALILSMSEKGRIDFDYMRNLTGFEKNKLIDDLHGDIYPVPELSTADNTVYQTADEYLSGNIYKKIAQAEEKIADNPAYAENIAALTEVIPRPLKATEIDMQLGMTWIDPKVIQQFMYETFDTPPHFRESDESVPQEQKNINPITVEYSGAGNGSWKIHNANRDCSVKSQKNFGTKEFNAYELLEKILNSKSVAVTNTITDPVTGNKKTVILEQPTRAAEDKVKIINNEFKKWIFADPERRNELVKTYNEKFNCIRPREYDGSHLNFFGSNPEISLKPHQKNAVAHALFGGNTLFAHEVGAGKTFEMIATAMEGKRLGLHNKSMFVVPNHLTEQIGSDFMKLYPNANILVAKPDDFSPQKRRQMCSRIATGNFDAVIIGHSQLIKIPLSPKREGEFIKAQMEEVVSSLSAAKALNGKGYTVKQLEIIKEKLRERLEKLINSTVKDNAVTFEELGVDKLFVDEAHEFKNLYVATKMENVTGLSTNADVQKTQDLYLKCQYLDEKTGGKGIVFSTGTPVTNALSEMFTTMKYLQSDLLKETNLNSFDSWAGNFTRKSTEQEISPSGVDWKARTRLKFINVPELVTMFKECADIKMADQLNLDVPECVKNIVSVEPTEAQKSVVESLGTRADKISKGEVSRTEDNMLVITSDGRKLGLDQRMYDLSLPDEPQSKLNACVKNVYDIWESTMDKRSTQLIFCDLGVPQSKDDLMKNGERFDVYADIRKKLIDKGIPEKEIAFIHDANSETEKAKLFAKVRRGDVRVLIGSTQKMGAGTNVQNKLVALHDLDCPWRPADLTQRLGRMVRQGNENDKVQNFRYVTKGTFDAYLYQMVEKKQKTIAQIFTSKAIARTYDDVDDTALDFMQVKMAAVGDDRIRRQMELREDIRNMNMLRNAYLESKYELQDNIKQLPKEIQKAEKTVEGIAVDVKMIESYKAPLDIDGKEIFQMKVDGQMINGKKEAAEAFADAMTKAIAKNPQNPTEIAEYKGFKIAVSYDPFTRIHHGTLKGTVNYPFELGSSQSGNITRIDNVIASVPKRTDVICNEIERMKNELAESRKEVDVPFEYETELAEKQQELERLTEEINADKAKGKIAPKQPESTVTQSAEKNDVPENQTDKSEVTPEAAADKTNTVSEKQSDKSEVTPEKAVQESAEKTDDKTNIQQTEKSDTPAAEPKKDVPEEKPEKLNLQWNQCGKKIRISFDSSAESPITAFANGKVTGTCKPEQLVVTGIPDNEKKKYPVGITHCVKSLNIAFGNNVAEYVSKFADNVKELCSKIKSREKTLFSREKIMSDKFRPTSGKDEKNRQNEIAH